MAGYKTPTFNDRAAASRAARESALEKLRNKAAPDPAVVAERKAAQEAREAAEAEKRAARKAAMEEAKAAKAAAAAERKAAEEAKAAVANKPKPTDAELKAARDARYAARKARKR
ncbi:DUF6481 family protein [Sphingomonas sp. HF-S3]|uniref:DUF6481 family protein n=1 Tax=Sphingomonas rustica TaxID=3103142 RepID=A0ABV0BDK5_9SPHN